jgi:hypothetical protein
VANQSAAAWASQSFGEGLCFGCSAAKQNASEARPAASGSGVALALMDHAVSRA